MSSAHNVIGYKYITEGSDGVPLIAGTSMKVVELVIAQLAYGWSPEELHFQFPHLSMSQIYAALAYYWDHKAELDADIEQRFEFTEALRRQARSTPLAAKLQGHGLFK